MTEIHGCLDECEVRRWGLILLPLPSANGGDYVTKVGNSFVKLMDVRVV